MTSRLTWIVQAAAGAIVLSQALYLALIWSTLPARVPSHFGWAGHPDRWSSRQMLWLLPLVSSVIFALLAYLSSVQKPEASAGFGRATRTIMAVTNLWTAALFGYILFATVQVATGKALGLGTWFAPAVLTAVFVTVLSSALLARKARANS